MSGAWWLLFLAIPVCGILGGVVTTWIRARYGYPLEDPASQAFWKHRGYWGAAVDDDGATGAWPRDRFAAEFRARDEKISALESRVRVLERIVTDRSSALGDEIDRLRDVS